MAWRGLLARLAPAVSLGSPSAAGPLLLRRPAAATTATATASRLAAARGLSTRAVSEATGSHHVDEPLEDVPR